MDQVGWQTAEEWRLVVLTPWSWSTIALATALALIALGLSLWALRQRESGRGWLAILRILAIAGLLLFVLQPGVRRQSVSRRPNEIAVLIDDSRSMDLRERAGQPTRRERVEALLKASETRLAAWNQGHRVRFYRFSDHLAPLPSGEQLSGRGTRSDIHAGLAELRERYASDDLGGVVLISDGADNGRFGRQLNQAHTRFVKALDVPVHTLRIGSADIADVAITRVFADDFAFVRNAVKVEAEVFIAGVPGVSEVPVKLVQGKKVLSEDIIAVEPGKRRYRAVFEFVPRKIGKFAYEIRTPLVAGEAIKDNNRRTFIVSVIRDRIRVLQVCGQPSWDERFLRDWLKRDPNIDLISFFILRRMRSRQVASPLEMSLIPFPTEDLFERELGSFDLVILQNFNFGPYGIVGYLPRLIRYVRDGGGLLMIGGKYAFGANGTAARQLSKILPAAVNRFQRNRGPNAPQESAEAFIPTVTKIGAEHPILQLGQQGGAQAVLNKLPPWEGANRLLKVFPDSSVLLTHPQRNDSEGRPMAVLATRHAGKGRTAALASDSSWLWAFPAVASGGDRSTYERLWQNLIRWIIDDPELQYLRVAAARARIAPGASQKVTFRAYRTDYQPAEAAKLRYTIAPLAASESDEPEKSGELTTDQSGRAELTFTPKQVGAYRIRAVADIGGRETKAKELFLVEFGGRELQDPSARKQPLQAIAAAGEGKFLDNVSSFPRLRFKPRKAVQVNWRRDEPLWDSLWSLLAIIFLFGADWALRRRYGYA